MNKYLWLILAAAVIGIAFGGRSDSQANGCTTFAGFDNHGSIVNSQLTCQVAPTAAPSGTVFVLAQATNAPTQQPGHLSVQFLAGDGTSITNVVHALNNTTGAQVPTFHCYADTFTASGVTQAITFKAAFANFPAQISGFDMTTGAAIGGGTVGSVTASGFTFGTVVNGQVYFWQACGY